MTTTVQYDLDTSGGLMDEIQALIAPPQTGEPTRKYRKLDRESRRTPRTTNRDSCDSCREGGDLICCDRCPASFHLQCCDPPLEDDDLPTGDWVCHKCIVAPRHITKSDAEIIAAMPTPRSLSLRDSHRPPEIKKQSGDYFKPRKAPVRLNDRLRRDGKQCMRLAQLQAYKEAQKEMKIIKKEEENEKEEEVVNVERSPSPDPDEDEELLRKKGNPLIMLIKAASIQNPKEFQLPAEIMTHAPLPGSTRKRRKEDPQRKQFYELENGMVPLPAKLCYICSRSCRIDPLIQCDYCPLVFHRDCLTPPLTQFPTGRWMCPNHPENGLPEFAKASYTEKCRIYHDINNRLNQHAVKFDFLNKVHATGPPPAWKEKPARRRSSEIPASVIDHYKHPRPLIPPKGKLGPSTSANSEPCSSLDQEQWLQSVVSLQSSIATHLARSEAPKVEPITQKVVTAPHLLTKPEKDPPTRFNHVHQRQQQPPYRDPSHVGGPRALTNGPVMNGPSKLGAPMGHEGALHNDRHSRLPHLGHDRLREIAEVPLKVTTVVVPPTVAKLKNNSKESSVSSILAASNMGGNSLSLKSSSLLGLNSTLQSCLEGSMDGELSQLDDRLVKVLAWQRLQQLMPPKTNPSISSRESSGSEKEKLQPILGVLCPLAADGPSVTMKGTCFTIGNGSASDLCLSFYKHCNYVSAKHACIFYERASRHFELLNYSEYGTRVDTALYSGKVKMKRSHHKKKSSMKPAPTLTVQTVKTTPNRTCVCHATNTNLNGWEGTASLRHGSHLQFGCLEFIFSIAESAVEPAS